MCAALCFGVTLSLIATSCRDDDVVKKGTVISFSLADSSIDTRSGEVTTTNLAKVYSLGTEITEWGDTIPMTLTITDRSGEGSATRSNPLNNSGNEVTKMRVEARTDNANKEYFIQEMTVSDGKAVVSGRYWPVESLTFFASTATLGQSFVPTFTNSTSNHTGTFSYTMPTADQTSDATRQPDLAVAIAAGKTKTTADVPLTFHHALTAVTFKVGTFKETATITNISLEGCKTSGDCSLSGDNAGNVAFTWSNQSGTVTYGQTVSKPTTDADKTINPTDYTFLIIPQTIDENTKVKITFTIASSGNTYTLTKSLKDVIASFDADKRYTITIGVNAEEVDIDVDDKMSSDGKTKDQITITNTGLSDGYIRAILVGYWVKDDVIVSPWTYGNGQGTANWGADWYAGGWIDHTVASGGDGFWYYKYVVPRGGQTHPVMVSYTLTAAAPVEGAHLEIDIMAQIVIKSGLDAAWPNHPSGMSDTYKP